jgi:Ca2+-dependent lipid-binding protein
MTGTLTIKLVEAELYRDTDVIGDMDPYVVFTFNKSKSTSKILDSVGKTPVWNEKF